MAYKALCIFLLHFLNLLRFSIGVHAALLQRRDVVAGGLEGFGAGGVHLGGVEGFGVDAGLLARFGDDVGASVLDGLCGFGC